MPRPPARRNRLVAQDSVSTVRPAKYASQGALLNARSTGDGQDNDGFTTTGNSELPVSLGRDALAAGTLRYVDARGTHGSTPRSNWTPAAISHEHAIESSPVEPIWTGSRPPTRARGYSSTLSLAGRKGDASSRTGGTPAFESSILGNFRRRPRQQSILQMMQADGSSDIDDDDFLGGLSPEDESTPLNISRSKSLVPNSLIASPSKPTFGSSPSSKDSRKRKRKSSELRKAQSSPESAVAPQIRSSPSSIQAASEPPSPLDLASLSSPNLTMAVPLSSSPGSPTPKTPVSNERLTLHIFRKRVGNASSALQDDEKHQVVPKLATSMLQERFLPRRRLCWQRIKNDGDGNDSGEEIESSEDNGSDEDELTSSKRLRRSRMQASAEVRSVNVKVKPKCINQKRAKKVGDAAKSAVTPKSAAQPNPSQSKSQVVTYSRRTSMMNKKNDLSDDSLVLSSPPPSNDFDLESINSRRMEISSRELMQQARKFAEVDKWQMDFEDVSVSGNQSSPSR